MVVMDDRIISARDVQKLYARAGDSRLPKWGSSEWLPATASNISTAPRDAIPRIRNSTSRYDDPARASTFNIHTQAPRVAEKLKPKESLSPPRD